MTSMSMQSSESGAVSAWLITAIAFIVISLVTGFSAYWALTNYLDLKTNFDTKKQTAVTDAVKKQADQDAAYYQEQEKKPNQLFAGPDDYGRLTFDYPKTWSVYVNQDGSGNGDTYEAYLNPVTVPPVDDATRYALRVKIEQIDYDEALSEYNNLVEDGSLVSSSETINGQPASRLEGNFSEDIRGIAVIFKIRDKTVTVRTDANTFKADFDSLVKTIKFNT